MLRIKVVFTLCLQPELLDPSGLSTVVLVRAPTQELGSQAIHPCFSCVLVPDAFVVGLYAPLSAKAFGSKARIFVGK